MSKDIHKHRCGLHLSSFDRDDRLDPPLAVEGCGHEWEHERIFLSKEDYAKRHNCPACGAGPWYRRVLSPLQKQQLEARIPETIRRAQDLRELTLLAGMILDALGFDEQRFQVIEERLHELNGGED